MAKPRVITRAARMLENAAKVKVNAAGRVASMDGMVADTIDPGLYALIPLEDVDAMVSALWREDARETRLEPTLRARKRKATK